MRFYLFIIVILSIAACSGTPGNSDVKSNVNKNVPNAAPVYTYEVVNTFPHDPKSFTQGLVIHDGFFYESAGQYGESDLRKVELATGKVVKRKKLSDSFFAEGMTILNDKIYQITWREFTGFVYDMDFNPLKEFRYQGEGWGLTNDGTNLIMSQGTHVIKFIDPENLQTIRTIVVNREDGKPLYDINELEYVNGEIWANIWRASDPAVLGKPNHIARIDPASGKILGWIDLGGIAPDEVKDDEKTLNGIAYDAASDRIFVTGKKWKKLFEIEIKPKP